VSRPKNSAGKKIKRGVSYYEARQVASLGEWADSPSYALVEIAQDVKHLRDVRKQKRNTAKDEAEFKRECGEFFGNEHFDAAWSELQNKVNYLADALMRLDEKPFEQLAAAILAYKTNQKSGPPHLLRAMVLDAAQELGIFSNGAGTVEANLTLKEFKAAMAAMWARKEKALCGLLAAQGRDRQARPFLIINDRFLRQICHDIGMPLKADKVGRPHKTKTTELG
jgi:hypothetical protein